MNPVELGQGTFPLSEAATDRFAIMVNIGYLPPEEEAKLVNFDFKQRAAEPADVEGAHHPAARARSTSRCSCTSGSATTSSGWSRRRGPTIPTPTGSTHSPSELVERGVDLGASPRAIICWGRLAKVWALLRARAATEVYPGGHPGSRAVRPRPPHLARPARRQPRPDDRSGDRGRHRAGADPVRTRDAGRGRRTRRRAARQPVGDHRDRAAHPASGCASSRSASTAACSTARASTSSACATGRPATASRRSTGRSRR